MLDLLFHNPAQFFLLSLYRIPVLILSLCFHEWAHAYVANRCGDPTARILGRMTLNPLRHLDVVGTLMMLTVGYGWARPVPVNPRNYRNRLADDIKVSLAGIVTNLILFLLFTALAVALNSLLWKPDVLEAWGSKIFLQLDNGINQMLVYDSQIYADIMRTPWLAPVMGFVSMAAMTNLFLAIFNFLPIPPLDGYHVFNDIILKGRLDITPQIAQIGMFALLALSVSTNVIGNVMYFLAGHVQGWVLQLFLMMVGRG